MQMHLNDVSKSIKDGMRMYREQRGEYFHSIFDIEETELHQIVTKGFGERNYYHV
jgi:hypothetical protein